MNLTRSFNYKTKTSYRKDKIGYDNIAKDSCMQFVWARAERKGAWPPPSWPSRQHPALARKPAQGGRRGTADSWG